MRLKIILFPGTKIFDLSHDKDTNISVGHGWLYVVHFNKTEL